jgi:L-cysteine desulfidase
VAIPGTGGLYGIDLAAALGALGGDPFRRLEVLDAITDDTVAKARDLVDQHRVSVVLLKEKKGLYIKAVVEGGGSVAAAVIEDFHDHIVYLSENHTEITTSMLVSKNQSARGTDAREIESWLKKLRLVDLIRLLDGLDEEDLEFLKQGVDHNLRLATYGLKYGSGLGIGKTLERLVRQKLIKRDMITAAKIMTSAASDARMAGVKLPAMSSAGSGNHGLTAILPIWAMKGYVACENKTLLEAIGLSHIITAYVKAFTGRLSAVCGCSIAAGAGAAAGITYLLGGDNSHIAGAIMNLTEDLAGVICDGAKEGCSLKLATAAGTAVQAALFSLQGVRVGSRDGIIAVSPERTMQNVGELSTKGMVETDRTIIKIMLEKQFGPSRL